MRTLANNAGLSEDRVSGSSPRSSNLEQVILKPDFPEEGHASAPDDVRDPAETGLYGVNGSIPMRVRINRLGQANEPDGPNLGVPVERVQAMRWIIVIVAVLVTAPGCGWKEESEKWRRTAEDYKAQLATANSTLDQTRTEHIEKLRAQSQKLSDAMLEASTKLDPLAIRKIYLNNRDLSDVARQLEAENAAAVPKDGDLSLSDAQLRFAVTDFKGRSVVRAYLDYESDPFLQCELTTTEPVLRVPYNIATEFYDELFKGSRAHASAKSFFTLDEHATDEIKDEIAEKLADAQFRARRGEIDARYKDAVTSAFGVYLKQGGSATAEGLPKPVFLTHKFRTPGRHEIRIQVEPKTPVWEVRLTATEVAKGQDEKIIKNWQINASTTPDLKNIPRMVFWIRYRPGD
jgi:hypothetical protein